MAAAIPHARVAEIPGAAHTVQLENPDAFAAALGRIRLVGWRWRVGGRSLGTFHGSHVRLGASTDKSHANFSPFFVILHKSRRSACVSKNASAPELSPLDFSVSRVTIKDMLFPPFAGASFLRVPNFWASTRQSHKGQDVCGPCGICRRDEPIRIAHLTDQHVGRVTPFAIQRQAIALTNAERPDLVVITGDFVCHSQLYLDQLIELVREFRAPVIGVLGNHDHWAGADEVAAALSGVAWRCWRNDSTIITIRRQRLQIIGLDDAYTATLGSTRPWWPAPGSSCACAVPYRRGSRPSLEVRYPAVLAGHTHGGQITVARLHEIALGKIGGHKYVHGLTARGSRIEARW